MSENEPILIKQAINGKDYTITLNPDGGYVSIIDNQKNLIASGQYINHINHLAINHEDTALIKEAECIITKVAKDESLKITLPI